MTKTKANIAVLIIVLVIAAMVSLKWLNATSTISQREIALNQKRCGNENINIRANLYSYSSGVIHLNEIECGPRSDAWATLEFDPAFLSTAMAKQFFKNIRDVREQGEYKMAEVRVTGRIEDLERQCFGPRFVLYVTQIEQLSKISIGRIKEEY